MAKPYSITITDGSGTVSAINGTYTVTTSVTGYDDTSIDPSSVTISGETTTLTFTVAATGTLTVHVSEEGTASGTAVSNAVFYRTDSSGSQNYGSSQTSDSSGNLTFANVPYNDSSPVTIYIKQTASDGDHNFSTDVYSVSMSSSTNTLEVTNALPSAVTVTYTDKNYENLPISSGTITLN